jgi:hypothetical protein
VRSRSSTPVCDDLTPQRAGALSGEGREDWLDCPEASQACMQGDACECARRWPNDGATYARIFTVAPDLARVTFDSYAAIRPQEATPRSDDAPYAACYDSNGNRSARRAVDRTA